jgi:hypothetical protein
MTTLCDFHAVRAVGDAHTGHGLPELAAVMSVAFKCVRRSLTGPLLDASILAFNKFVEGRVREHLPYVTRDDVDWVRQGSVVCIHERLL